MIFKRVVRLLKYVLIVFSSVAIGFSTFYYIDQKNTSRLLMQRFQSLNPEEIHSVVLYRGNYDDVIEFPRIDITDKSKIKCIYEAIKDYDMVVDPSHPSIVDSCFLKFYANEDIVFTFYLYATSDGKIVIENGSIEYYSKDLSRCLLNKNNTFLYLPSR